MTNNYTTEADKVGGALEAVFLKKVQGSSNASKNIVTDSNGNIISEAKTTTNITDPSAYAHLGTSANSSQASINLAINNKIGSIIDFFNGTGS